MQKRLRILIFAIFMIVSLPTTFALFVDDLNEVTVVVSDRSPKALSDGLQQGLAQALIKLSGNPNIAALPEIQKIMPTVSQWVQSYAYAEQKDAQGNTILQLQMQFDRAGLKKLLDHAGQVVWRGDRPLTLVALHDDTNQIQPVIQRISKTRALPIIFPMMDLSDQSTLSNTAVERADLLAKMQALSKRYGVNSILLADFQSESNHDWRVHWNYFLSGQLTQWESSGSSQEALANSALDKIADLMVSHPVVSTNTVLKSTVTMDITGVSDISSYAKVMQYLRSKSNVVHVTVKDMSPSGMLLSIDVAGDVAQFQQLLGEDGQLKPVTTASQDPAHVADLHYYW